VSDYTITLVKSLGITERERQKRIAHAFNLLLSPTDSDAPGTVVEAGPGASGIGNEARRRSHDTSVSGLAQIAGDGR